ncbi:hypothetical protein FSP39_003577 [Pinctada imbricata]|uniref:Uncharacterized protein n=1 Tax=Pinctada imbricata TaxID=66713 RepID=A0AA88XPJ8_PINIB|nr:hypothetical protein FSP39_003577 [Pinctada imbricata]
MASSECIAESTSKRRRQDSESDETKVPKLSRSGRESSTTDSETIDITSSSQSQTESSSGDNRQVSRWSEFWFDTLRIQVIRKIFDPPEVFNSFNDFFENDDKKRELICSWFEKHDEKRVTKYADVYRAFEKIVLLDCDNIEKTDVRMNNDLVWLYRSLARDQGDSLGLLKVRLVDFLAQLIYMVSEVKTNGPESLKEGMYQELFVRFTKIFGLEIV